MDRIDKVLRQARRLDKKIGTMEEQVDRTSAVVNHMVLKDANERAASSVVGREPLSQTVYLQKV